MVIEELNQATSPLAALRSDMLRFASLQLQYRVGFHDARIS